MANIIDYQLQNGGLGAYDYTPFGKFGSITSNATTGVFSTLLSVTGKGLLHKAVLQASTSGATLRISIDGVVIAYLNNNNGTTCFGILQSSDIFNNAGNLQTVAGVSASGVIAMFGLTPLIPSIPLATKQAGSIPTLVLSMPFKFSSSLLIEACHELTASSSLNYGIGYSLGS